MADRSCSPRPHGRWFGQSLPTGCALRDLGAHRLKDLEEPEQLFQLALSGLPTDFPTDFPHLKTLDYHQHNLPIQPTTLLDREEQIPRCVRS